MYCNLAGLRTEYGTLYSNEITNVKQSLEKHVVSVLVFARAYVIACYIYLDTVFFAVVFFVCFSVGLSSPSAYANTSFTSETGTNVTSFFTS